MGHSMGNFVTIAEMLRSHDAEALRLYYAMRHYRTPLEFDEADIGQAEQVLDKMRAVYNQFRTLAKSVNPEDKQAIDTNIERLSSDATKRFVEAMDDDFNTPRALASMITYAKDVEPYASKETGRVSVELVIRTLDYFAGVFGIMRMGRGTQEEAFEGLLKFLLKLREDARKKGDYATADSIRDNLTKLGVGLEDTPAGIRWYMTASGRASSS